jgi:hypothetical protein
VSSTFETTHLKVARASAESGVVADRTRDCRAWQIEAGGAERGDHLLALET